MKKTAKILCATMVLAMSTSSFASCGGTKIDPNALLITAAELGYGLDWLGDIVDAYEKKTGTEVIVVKKVGQSGVSAISTELESLASETDLFITRSASYFKTVYQGSVSVKGNNYDCLYADLTDVWNAEVDGKNGVTIKSKTDARFEKLYNVDGKYHTLPWAGGIMGIIRNNIVWKQLGFTDSDTPLTTDMLFEVCDKILVEAAKNAATKDVAPFIYSLADEYYGSIVPIWFAQYEGKEGIERFINGLDPEGLVSPNIYTYDGQDRALRVLSTLLDKNNKYQHTASDSLDFTSMQSYFLLNQAVFCVNGAWLEIEMGSKYKNSDIEYIKMPIVSALAERLSYYSPQATDNDTKLRELISFVDAHPAEGDNTGAPAYATAEDVEIVREARHMSYSMSGSDHTMIIPSYSDKVDVAKDFLKFMYSDEGLNLYYKSTGGAMLPVTPSEGYNSNGLTLSKFRKNINEVIEENYLFDFGTGKAKIFSLGNVGMRWTNGGGSAVNAILNGKTVDEIMNTNDSWIRSNWNTIQKVL